jgi:hypothetical protein
MLTETLGNPHDPPGGWCQTNANQSLQGQ